MQHSKATIELFAEYSAIAGDVGRRRDADEEVSLQYFSVDLALRSGQQVLEPSRRVRNWVTSLLQLERFTFDEGRLPRENNRLDRGQITGEERRLTEWARYQRRTATQIQHCAYQTRRLETVPGFRWNPLSDQWRQNFDEYFRFVTRYGAPAYRSKNAEQHKLASWASRQRRAHALGVLPLDRFELLDHADYWAWTVTAG